MRANIVSKYEFIKLNGTVKPTIPVYLEVNRVEWL